MWSEGQETGPRFPQREEGAQETWGNIKGAQKDWAETGGLCTKSLRGVCALQVWWPPPGSELSPLRCPPWDTQQRTHSGCYMGSATRGEEGWRKSRTESPLRWAMETSIFFYLRQNNIFSYWKSKPWWLQEKEEKIHKNRKKWEHHSPDVLQIGRKRRDSHDPSPTPSFPISPLMYPCKTHTDTQTHTFLQIPMTYLATSTDPRGVAPPPGHERTSAIFAGLPSASRERCCSSHTEGQRLEKEDKHLLPHTCINTTILKKSYCASTLLFEGLFRNLGFSWFLILIQEPVGSKGDGRVHAQVSLKGISAYLPTSSTSPPGNSYIEYSEYMSIHIYLVREDI